MEHTWFLASFWMALAVLAALLALQFRVSAALIEIIIGILGQYLATILFGKTGLNPKEGWITFLAGLGAIMLTFMAGSELDPTSFRKQWKEATFIGLLTFLSPS
nr:cation:proton antiporter [Methylacidiphilum kamchatkense]